MFKTSNTDTSNPANSVYDAAGQRVATQVAGVLTETANTKKYLFWKLKTTEYIVSQMRPRRGYRTENPRIENTSARLNE